MRKQQFINFLDKDLKNLSPNAKIVQLNFIKTYLDEYTKNVRKDFSLCPYCKKYSFTKDFAHHIESRKDWYIGKHRFGKVTYIFSRCPLCSHATERVLSTKNLIKS